MPSSKSTPKKSTTTPARAASRGGKTSRSSELTGEDLDKVTGGMRATGGLPGPKGGDPCDGGE